MRAFANSLFFSVARLLQIAPKRAAIDRVKKLTTLVIYNYARLTRLELDVWFFLPFLDPRSRGNCQSGLFEMVASWLLIAICLALQLGQCMVFLVKVTQL